MVKFDGSNTQLNLMRAFAGESQARNRYTFAAGQCAAKKLFVLERLFLYTAGQEKEHAEIFYGYLTPANGKNISVQAEYPVGNYEDAALLLKDAQHNEMQEYSQEYRRFSEIAAQEGFAEIAAAFRNIAEIEKTHSDRFGRYLELYEGGRLFTEPQESGWLCLNCGHVHYGTNAPEICPVCRHEQGYFVREDRLR